MTPRLWRQHVKFPVYVRWLIVKRRFWRDSWPEVWADAIYLVTGA